MRTPNAQRRLWFAWAGVALVAAITLVSCLLHQSRGNGWDFFAYYKAALRWSQGGDIYTREAHYAFKYGAITAALFTPFAWFSYTTARWIFASLHLITALLLPWAVWRLAWRDPALKARLTPFTFPAMVGLGFLAGFRFVDAEFRASNVGLFITAAFVGAAWLGSLLGWARLSPLLLGLGAVVKVHTLVVLAVFRWNDRRTLLALLGTVLALWLIPHPLSWWRWWEQMTAPEVAMHLTAERHNIQGFFIFANRFFGWDAGDLRCGVLAVPFGLWAWWRLPRFRLGDIPFQPAAFLLTVLAWALLAWMASPLPWQHTYSLLWVMVPLAWVQASAPGRKRIFWLALFLGLTPRDIVGKQLFLWLEGNQSVFLAILGFWCVVVSELGTTRRSPRGSGIIAA